MRSYGVCFRIWTIIAASAICYAAPAGASAQRLYWLDEGAGIVTVVGRGRPPAAVEHPAQARLLAERAAIGDAYSIAARLLSEAIPQAVPGQEGYSVFVRGGTVGRSNVASDGSVTVELQIPVHPELAGRVRKVMQGMELLERGADERAESSREQFLARHCVKGPRAITRREWINRYRTGSWVSYVQSSGSRENPDSRGCLHSH